MKNWVLKYSFLLITVFVIQACSSTDNGEALATNKNTVLVYTNSDLEDFQFYSNASFSTFIKELICEPIFYYDSVKEDLHSEIIQSFKWIHDSEIELELKKDVPFQFGNQQLYKKRNVAPKDIIHSINLYLQNNPYDLTDDFLKNISQMTEKKGNSLVISLHKSVHPALFLAELAALKIPVIPTEVKEISHPKDLIGTGLYSMSEVRSNQIIVRAFKEHKKYKQAKNNSIDLPDNYILHLGYSVPEIQEIMLAASFDMILIDDISFIPTNFEKFKPSIKNLFIRQEDRIHLAALNLEQPFTSEYKNIEFIKKMISPEDFSKRQYNNQLNTFYSKYELESTDEFFFNSISLSFKNCDPLYEDFVRNSFRNKGIEINDTPPIDLLIYQLNTPTFHDVILRKYIYDFYSSNGFIDNPDIAKEANIKLFYPVSYLIVNRKIHFLNDRFEFLNDFSTIFKGTVN